MRVLVAAASKHGATAEIAERIGERLRDRGLEVDVSDIAGSIAVADYQAFVIGSGVYAGHWLKPARKFIERNSGDLVDSKIWLFSSGPLGDPPKPDDEDAVDVSSMVEELRPVEHKLLAGAIDKQKLSFGERAILKAVKAVDGDYRDWDAVAAWADEIAGHLGAGI